jgi:hypothetical protein
MHERNNFAVFERDVALVSLIAARVFRNGRRLYSPGVVTWDP